jgi:glutamyl-tRNA reductase
MKERRAEARKVQPIIAEEVAKFEAWRATLGVVPAIVALRARAETIRQEELARTSAVLGKLSEEDRRRIEALTLAIEKKLLHHPIALLRARAAAGDGHETLEALRELFGLDATAAATSDSETSKKDDVPKVTRTGGRTGPRGLYP